MQATFKEWLECKGAGKVAETLKLEPNTVYSWAHRNVIPRKVWPDIILAYSEIGLNDLLNMEAASK